MEVGALYEERICQWMRHQRNYCSISFHRRHRWQRHDLEKDSRWLYLSSKEPGWKLTSASWWQAQLFSSSHSCYCNNPWICRKFKCVEVRQRKKTSSEIPHHVFCLDIQLWKRHLLENSIWRFSPSRVMIPVFPSVLDCLCEYVRACMNVSNSSSWEE